MANYYGLTRTNYFQVTDEEKFLEIMSRCCGFEDGIEVVSETDQNNIKRFMFYSESGIAGFCNDDDDYDINGFHNALQSVVAENDAIIITEVGHEKMRYLVGWVDVITRNEIKSESLEGIGKRLAREMLKNKEWDTKNSY